jgi:hypothetical protein
MIKAFSKRDRVNPASQAYARCRFLTCLLWPALALLLTGSVLAGRAQAGRAGEPAGQNAPRTPVISSVSQALPAPSQVTGLVARHRSGQSFLTWHESDEPGAYYRLYRYQAPINAGNLAQAALLYEVPAGSSRFYANLYRNAAGLWQPRLSAHLTIEDGGPELSDGTGLLVWTLTPEDLALATAAYYAATTVSAEGVENRVDFASGNTYGPVEETVSDPTPVEAGVNLGLQGHAFIQYMDLRAWNPTFHAPNPANGYYGLDPADSAVKAALQYAYDYYIYTPSVAACGAAVPDRVPVVLALHAWGGNIYGLPSEPVPDWCVFQVVPVDQGETWYFGFARDHDYRLGSSLVAGDAIVNFTESRILRMVYDLLRDPNFGSRVDADRIYVYGHSMGASGALALALRYPNVFAAAYAGQPMTNYRLAGGWLGDVTPKWGAADLNLPVEIRGPGAWANHLQSANGTGVWDWQNHQATLRGGEYAEMALLGVEHSVDDLSVMWATEGAPFYAALDTMPRSWGGLVIDGPHQWDYFGGLPPDLARGSVTPFAPFANLQVRRGESVPGLARASANPPLTPTVPAGYNQTILWSSSWAPWDGPPVDTAARWQISLCAVAPDPPHAADCGTGQPVTVDIAPRRLQKFIIQAGASYRWQNRQVSDDALVASGIVTATATNSLIVPAFLVAPTGNRLILRPAGTRDYQVYLPVTNR